MNGKQKLSHPAFIVAIALLILNDHFLKQAYPGWFTGKLSDVAGLFAFPFFLAALCPRRALPCYVLTAVAFVLWKSPVAEPIIRWFNGMNIPLGRVQDVTDDLALLILPLSYHMYCSSTKRYLRPALTGVVMAIAVFGFAATSLPPTEKARFSNLNKVYTFNFSKRELAWRLNSLQLDHVREQEKAVIKYNQSVEHTGLHADSAWIDFDQKNNNFYYATLSGKKDTIAHLIDPYVITDNDSISLKATRSFIKISGDSISSVIKLQSVYHDNALVHNKDKSKKEAIASFEKMVIEKIRDYGR